MNIPMNVTTFFENNPEYSTILNMLDVDLEYIEPEWFATKGKILFDNIPNKDISIINSYEKLLTEIMPSLELRGYGLIYLNPCVTPENVRNVFVEIYKSICSDTKFDTDLIYQIAAPMNSWEIAREMLLISYFYPPIDVDPQLLDVAIIIRKDDIIDHKYYFDVVINDGRPFTLAIMHMNIKPEIRYLNLPSTCFKIIDMVATDPFTLSPSKFDTDEKMFYYNDDRNGDIYATYRKLIQYGYNISPTFKGYRE